MKHMLKRIVSLTMVLALLFGCLPAQALALQTPGDIHTAQTEISLNPLYEGLVDEALLLSRHPQMPDAEINADSAADYVDEAGAVELLRAAMVSRLGTVVIPIATADTDHNAQMKRIFQAALKHTGNPVEGDYLMWQYASWKASSRYYEDSGIRYYTTTFTLSYYTDAEQEAVVDTAVEALLNDLDLDGGTDYEKVKGIYDYICANVTYDNENLNDSTYTLKHSAYAALIDGTAVCQGYALLLYRLALELGVDCRLVAGLGGGGAHGWNILQLEGLYYNADSTWDAGDTAYSWFLLSEENFSDHTRGNYSDSNGMDYSSAEFSASYPMGTENYTPTVSETVAEGTCGENLTWKLDDGGRLTVSGTGAMTDFTSSGQPWRDWKQEIRSVVIAEGVTSVGDYAFFHCYSLEKATLPDTLTRIGSSAFFYCSALTEVKLPENLQTIADHAFGSCKVLNGMDFPAALKTIGVTAFSGTEVSRAVLPEGITTVGSKAFMGCPLTEAFVPASLESIGYCAFQDCTELDAIAVDANNPVYCNDSQGAMYTRDMETLIVVPGGYAGEFVIPDSVTAITGCAMRNCDLLTGVTIPKTVSEIGELAFYDSAALESVVWPAAAAKVPRSAFSWCTGLGSIKLPEGVTVLDQSAFYGCDLLTEIAVPASVTELGSLCFGQSGLKTVTFLGDPPAFTNADTFTDVTAEARYPADNANWTEEVRQQYGGTITWTAVEKICAHEYEAAVTAPTCTESGCTTYTCSLCGDSYQGDFTDALGHDYVDGSCSRCGEASPFYTSPAVTSNLDGHWYTNAQRWAHPINSYLRQEGDGYLRVEYTGMDLAIEEYDADFRFVTGRKLALELPLFGGVYLCDDYNFVMVGQVNLDEEDTAEVIRVIRYSKDWQRLDSASLYGANTVQPFRPGSARFDRCGDMLYIRTGHSMYADENGLNHQANLTMAVRISDMTVTDEYSVVMNVKYGYVSHSFNQFIRVDGTTLLAVDHGDAYPRSVVLMKYPYSAEQEYFAGRVSYVETLPIAGTIGDNDTGVSVGGFEFSSTHYLIAGSSAEQVASNDMFYAHRNIFVTATSKDNFTAEGTVLNWITSYEASDDVEISPTHLVKIASDRFLLMWTADDVLTYCFLDGQGNRVGENYTADGALSDCSPIVVGDRVIWYVTNHSEPKFYILDLNNPGSVTWPHTHEYSAAVTEPTCTERGFTTYTCTVCGYSYTDDYTEALDHNWSDATCTAAKTCSRCGVTEGAPLGHDLGEWIVEREATCTQSGKEYRLCSRCDFRSESVTGALGHNMVTQIVEATCTKRGYQTAYCERCDYHEGYTYTDALGHNYVDGICTRCGVEEPAVEGVIRLSGKNRYDTAFAVANQLKRNLKLEQFEAVVVAYGQNFPDALTGSYLAAVKNAPILLTEKSADARVLAYIEENLVPGGTVYILGGTAAVTQEFEDGANERGFTVKRLKDKNRYGTNLKILEEAGVNQTDEILIATGTNYADSLSASATGLPMLLVGGSLTEEQKAFLATTSGRFVIIGGTGAVSQKVEDQLNEIGTAERVKGKTRYETSVVIAQRYFSDPAAAILAYAQGFPDGLCGGPLAVSMGAPLILTSNESSAAADDYIEGITVGAVTGGTGRLTDETVREIFDLDADTEIPKQ